MKIIKYNLCTMVSIGTAEEPQLQEVLSAVTLHWSEANEEIAKAEAYNGEYTIEDDGTGEEIPMTEAQRIAQLEQALELLLSGVTE